MRYWWVNQKRTHRHEIAGRYLWSPKRKRDGSRNPFYETMREVAPGDLVFCYWGSEIRAIGQALWFCYDAPKPEEFGEAGRNWSAIGYRVDVRYRMLARPVDPRGLHWPTIKTLLPDRYSPLNPKDGKGMQPVYLTEVRVMR